MLELGQETQKYFTDDYELFHKNEETDQLEYLIPEKSSLRRHLQCPDKKFVDFLSYLLQINPRKRPAASEALQHRWLSCTCTWAANPTRSTQLTGRVKLCEVTRLMKQHFLLRQDLALRVFSGQSLALKPCFTRWIDRVYTLVRACKYEKGYLFYLYSWHVLWCNWSNSWYNKSNRYISVFLDLIYLWHSLTNDTPSNL